MTTREGESNGRRLFTEALAGGAQALQRETGAIAAGKRADIIVLDDNHPDLVSARDDARLDAWVFVAGRAALRSVFVDGRQVVAEGRHHDRDAIGERYRATLARLAHA
jgi:cytosine/adenosine deaminase-related metal-dependent hydrolase